jgi:hypothetical protein
MAISVTYNYERPIYAFDWSSESAKFCHLAVASFDRNPPNSVEFLSMTNPSDNELIKSEKSVNLQYPTTKVQWSPCKVKLILI